MSAARRRARRLGLAAAAALLSACAAGAGRDPGVTVAAVEADRWRVVATGRAGESRARVENRLLLGAAEAVLAAGATHFAIDDREVETTTTWVGDDGFSEFGYARDLPAGAGFGSSAVTARAVTRHVASGEIVARRDIPPGGAPGVYDAAVVVRTGGSAADPAT